VRRWIDSWRRGPARTGVSGLKGPDFRLFWAGESVSLLGSQVSLLAFPLLAVLLLHARAQQTGLLAAAQTIPFLFLSLPAGLLVDRVARRAILIASNAVRALLLGTIPVLQLAGALSMGALYGIAFLVGSFTVLYAAAYQAYLPTLVPAGEIVAANGRLTSSESIAQASGPPIAGALAQAASASVGILLDACTFAIAAGCQLAIRHREPAAERPAARDPLALELLAGLRTLWRNRPVRVAAIAAAHWNFCIGAVQAVMVIYAVRSLRLSPGLLGAVLAMGSVGAVLSAMLVARLIGRVGVGRAMIGGAVLGSIAPVMFPLAERPAGAAAGLLALGYFLQGLAGPLCGVTAASVFQHTVAPQLLGRVSAARRLISWGAEPLGALAAGALATQLGIRGVLLGTAVLSCTMWLWVVFSPWRRLHELPGPQGLSMPSPTTPLSPAIPGPE
jgi:MFS family permease